MNSSNSLSKAIFFFLNVPMLQKEWRVYAEGKLSLGTLFDLLKGRESQLMYLETAYFFDVYHQVYLDPKQHLEDLGLDKGVLIILL